ncbi:hypothetical protein BpHYR1_005094 [Brachionus plicatilis]|uniref:Uncharacterized protein n=1 Tax=Brachionus plicatilis TaxID=10195 RepID=A0A3M7QZ95_BRAPC|nr:hypothetical protein BpHYR1_005094 [Brachionus plicatilis]
MSETIEEIGSKFDKSCRKFEIAEMIINETLIFLNDRKNSGLTFMDYSSISEPIENSTVQINAFKNLISDFNKYSLEQRNIDSKIESITKRVNETRRNEIKQIKDLQKESEEIEKKKIEIIENLNQINVLIQDAIIEFLEEKDLMKNDFLIIN